jgi:hypothetical protein
MDILAGMLAYVAGIGALVGAVAISFSVFFAAPNRPLQTENQPQSASAMLVRPSTAGTLNKRTAIGAVARPGTAHSEQHAADTHAAEKHAAAAGPSGASHAPASPGNLHRKTAPASAQARRLTQEERARRWAYQQDTSQSSTHDSSFESRFLGYAD